MALLKTGKLVAAILQDDPSLLNPLERATLPVLKRAIPYRRSIYERWLFGQRVALEMSAQGIRNFLVLGAGVPTSGHVHQLVSDASVVYVDRDPEIVELAQTLIGDSPAVRYVQGDIGKLKEDVLPHLVELWGLPKKMGIIMVGVSYFLPDDLLENAFRSLYEWSEKDSMMALSVGVRNRGRPLPLSMKTVLKIYEWTGNKVYERTCESVERMAAPWKLERAEVIIRYGDYAQMSGMIFRNLG